jgi:preprotein translocase subunit SecB
MEDFWMTDEAAGGANGAAQPTDGRGAVAINVQYIKDLSFESPNVLQLLTQESTGTPEVSFNLGVQVNPVSPDNFEVVLTVRAEAKRGDVVAFIIELVYAGLFTITGIPPEQLEPLLFIEGPRLLFPFARAIVADLTREGGYSPLLLNPIDFVDLYRRKLAENQGAALSAAPTTNPN